VTTTFEALWKNVPVVTKVGYNFNSRCGESILKNANIDNFIATSNDDYIKKAVFYANNITELENTREELFNKILETPLFDTKEFSKDFCEALKNMQKLINKNYK
jgi:predicted O-linked N-acetylglucosamine transferase (SPINDLY family)